MILRGPAAALAGYMDESLSIPTATSFRTLGVATLDAQRRQINGDLKEAGRSEKLSFTHLIAWAIIRAAQALPSMGTGFQVIDGKPHKLVRECGQPRPRRGRRAQGRQPLAAGAGGARRRRPRLPRLPRLLRRPGQAHARRPGEARRARGATITLTNPGGLGTVASVPRLMPGQGTIVATGAIGYPAGLASARPEALRELGVEKVMTMTSTYDHRVIQGAESGAFLARDRPPARRRRRLLRADPRRPRPGRRPRRGEGRPGPRQRAGRRRRRSPTTPCSPASPPRCSLVKAHRSHGHLAARLDPLGSEPPGDPALSAENVGLTPEIMARIPASLLRVKVPGESFAAALPHLRTAYCGTIAYEIEHLSDHQKRLWLRGVIESGRLRDAPQPRAPHRDPRAPRAGGRLRALPAAHLPRAEDLLHRGRGRPRADHRRGHRARRPRRAPRRSCSAWPTAAASPSSPTSSAARPSRSSPSSRATWRSSRATRTIRETAGDVKYHLGAEGTYVTRSGRSVTVKLAANPSHLEQVNAVAEGHTRALQTQRSGREPRHDPSSRGARR